MGGRVLGLAAVFLCAGAVAFPSPPARAEGPSIQRICTLIETSARRHGLPEAFFARLIYKESRFDARAISPVGAQGIAQFMPATAAERGLTDPYDPEQAIPASAHLLADLHGQFGNWGLAAAAYNGGPDRVARWLGGRGGLPYETIDYVRSITYRPVEWFRLRGREVEPRPLDTARGFAEACHALPILPTRAVLAVATRQPWGVQVAGGASRRAALNGFARVSRALPSILGGRQPMVVRAGRVGAPYVARIGEPTRRAAGQLCARIKAAGGSCVVMRN